MMIYSYDAIPRNLIIFTGDLKLSVMTVNCQKFQLKGPWLETLGRQLVAPGPSGCQLGSPEPPGCLGALGVSGPFGCQLGVLGPLSCQLGSPEPPGC